MRELEKQLNDASFTKAVVCYICDEDKVLLGLRKKVSLNFGENLIVGIGGKLEEGETEEEGVMREVYEEIGVWLLKFVRMGRVRFLFSNKPEWNQNVTIFVAEKWDGDPVETDVIEPRWYEKKKLPESQMWHDNQFWVPKVLDGERVNAAFLIDEDKKVVEQRFY